MIPEQMETMLSYWKRAPKEVQESSELFVDYLCDEDKLDRDTWAKTYVLIEWAQAIVRGLTC
jgi:hypothetical protein